MSLLTEIALRTSRIGLATEIVSVWGRTPATIALTAAGLQRCSVGRFSLGLGAGSPPLAEGFHRVAWDRPFARLRETLTAVRALLAGERLPDPAPGARALRLGMRVGAPVPIELAALAPASIRLAGELADRWLPFLWAQSRLHEGRAATACVGCARQLAHRCGQPITPAVAALRLRRDRPPARRRFRSRRSAR